MSLCTANSGPLSVVIVFRLSLYGSSSFLTTFARGFDIFQNGSFCINNILVDFSTIVSMACWAGSTIKSISKSPNPFPSTSLLLSWILTLSFIGRCSPLEDACISSYALCALQVSLLCHCGWCYRMDWWDTSMPSFMRRYPDICRGDHWVLGLTQRKNMVHHSFFTI